jgi:oligopeptide/dipeptide ABC transporter ATP-binding protein
MHSAAAASPTRAPLLEVANLEVGIETAGGTIKLVSEVNFDIRSGEAVALVGESGSGKTMTALAILGLLPQGAMASGDIRFKGQELIGLRPAALNRIRGKQIAIVFQEPMSSLNPAFTVGEQIAETVRHHLRISHSSAKDRTIELLAMVGIPEPGARVGDYPHMFSGGMLQRVGIAMALSCEPDLLIADEPTTALDATVQAQVLDLLASLRDRSKTSLLFLTHDFGAVAALCDRAEVMYCGQIVESSPCEELFDRPIHPYTEGLLGAMARLDRDCEPTPIAGSAPPQSAYPSGCRFHPRCAYAEEACFAGPMPELQFGERRARCRRAGELTLVGST